MANLFRNTQWISMTALRALVGPLEIADGFNTDYNKDYRGPFKKGATIDVRYPQEWLIRDGAAYAPQGITNLVTPVTIDQQFGIDFDWTSAEAALNLDDVEENLIVPAMLRLSTEIDRRASIFAFRNTPNVVGTLGTAITTYPPYFGSRQRLMELDCPEGDKKIVLSPAQMTNIAANNLSLFNPTSEQSRIYQTGKVGRSAGFDWFESNNLQTHTAGTWAGAVTVNGSGQSGTSLIVNATAGDTFKRGDTISIGAVNAVSPSNKQSTETVANFIVTADLTAVGGGVDSLSIYPGIVGPGEQYQNVNALPITGSALTLFPGTTSPNGKTGRLGLAFHRNAYAMVAVELEAPKGSSVELISQARDPKTGIAVRFVRQYEAAQDRWVNRFDVLMGFGRLWAYNAAVRIASNS